MSSQRTLIFIDEPCDIVNTQDLLKSCVLQSSQTACWSMYCCLLSAVLRDYLLLQVSSLCSSLANVHIMQLISGITCIRTERKLMNMVALIFLFLLLDFEPQYCKLPFMSVHWNQRAKMSQIAALNIKSEFVIIMFVLQCNQKVTYLNSSHVQTPLNIFQRCLIFINMISIETSFHSREIGDD